MHRFIRPLKTAATLMLGVTMTVTSLPTAALAAAAPSQQETWRDDIDSMLSRGSYEKGQAVAVVSASTQTQALDDTGSNSILADCEPLAQTTGDVYEQTVGDEAAVASYALDDTVDAATTDDAEIDIVLVKRKDMSTEQILRELAKDDQVLYAEPNYTQKVSDENGDSSDATDTPSTKTDTSTEVDDDSPVEGVAPADRTAATLLSKDQTPDLTAYQWGYDSSNTTGAFAGAREAGFDANVPNWNDASQKNADGIVAIMDVGVDYTHPDLAGSMADMSAYTTKIGGGKYGFNATDDGDFDEASPMDDHGHGTHVAGIVAAQWDGHGTSGAVNGAKILAVKIGSHGTVSYGAAIRGSQYLCDAVDAGADIRVVNDSWGAETTSVPFLMMVNALGRRGVVSVCASGNDTVDLDKTIRTGSGSAASPYSILVNAASPDAKKTIFTNWGQATTDVYAPGSGILSTFPYTYNASGDDAEKATAIMGSYMPAVLAQAGTAGNLAYTSFDANDTSGIEAYVGYGPDAIKSENRIAATSSTWHFDQSPALQISGSQLLAGDQGEQDGGQAKHSYAVTLKIPIAKADLEKATNFNFSTASDTGNYTVVMTSLEAKQTNKRTGKATTRMVRDQWQTTRACTTLGWAQPDISFSNIISNFGSPQPGDADYSESDRDEYDTTVAYHETGNGQGYIVMAIMFMTTNDYKPVKNEHVYLDCVGIGNVMVPYAFMSGTSMASPLVAGAAAVASTHVDRSLEPSERALELASLIKSCVTERTDFTGTCTSNGSIDLSKLAAEQDRQPQIDRVTTGATDGTATITVTGSNFGSETGAVTIAGHEAKIKGWADSSITVERPSALTSGKRLVEVTTADGKTCSKTAILTFSEGASKADLPLYEEEIPLNGQFDDSRGFKMVALGDDIYVFPAIRNSDTGVDLDLPYRELWRYSTTSKTWTDLGKLPEPIGTVSVTAHQGKLLVLSRGVDGGSDLMGQHLYSYDPQSSTWTQLKQAESAIPIGAAIIDANGTLLAIGGSEGVEDDQEKSLTGNNIAQIDLKKATATSLGSLATPRSMINGKDACDIKLAISGSSIYVMGGARMVYEGDSSKIADAMPGTEILTRNADGTYAARDITAQLPTEKKLYDGRFGIVADGGHVVVAGYKTDTSDEDSFLMTAKRTKGLGRRANYSTLSWADALLLNGKLYVIGIDEFAGGTAVMRATKLGPAASTPAKAGADTKVNGVKATGTSKSLPGTGDNTLVIISAIAVAGLALALIGIDRSRAIHR